MRLVPSHKHMIFSNEQDLKFKIVIESLLSSIIYVSRCIMFKNSISSILLVLFNNIFCTIIKYCTLDTHSGQW